MNPNGYGVSLEVNKISDIKLESGDSCTTLNILRTNDSTL